MAYDERSFQAGIAVGRSLYTIPFRLNLTLTVIWLDGDGSELDRKTYQQGTPEPTTYLIPTKLRENEYYYLFDSWDEGSVEGTVTTYRPIFQRLEDDVFQFTVSGYAEIQIVPVGRQYLDEPFIIDWGDGTSEGQNYYWQVYPHHYADDKIYTVTVTGKTAKIGFRKSSRIFQYPEYDLYSMDIASFFGNRSWLRSIITPFPAPHPTEREDEYPKDYSVIVSGFPGLQSIHPRLFYNCADKITDIRNAFKECTSLHVPETIFYDLPHLTDFSGCFAECRFESGIPEKLFAWNTEAENFTRCFNGSYVASIPEKLFARNTKAKNFDRCFQSCVFNPNYLPYDIYTNERMYNIYTDEQMLELMTPVYIPQRLFYNNGDMETAEYCFSGYMDDIISGDIYNRPTAHKTPCNSLSYFVIPPELFAGKTKLRSVKGCFSGNRYQQQIPVNIFSGCVSIEDFSYLFYCANVVSIPSGLFDDAFNAISFKCSFADYDYIIWSKKHFDYPVPITSIPSGLFVNCHNVTSFESTFASMQGQEPYIEHVPQNLFANDLPQNVTFAGCFYGNITITSSVPALWEKYSNGVRCFRYCRNAANYSDIPASWR